MRNTVTGQAESLKAERKHTKKTLRESEAQLRALIENLPFEFWVRDSANTCTMQNAV